MSRFPQFTAQENLNRALMDKNTRYLVVEGPFDMPIYAEAVSMLIDKHQLNNKPLTVFGGGKPNIVEWCNTENPQNTTILLDMDFDNPSTDFSNDRINLLHRYSIENYFFDESVNVYLVSNLLTRNPEDVMTALSLDELKEHWLSTLSGLLPVIFYYQKRFSGDKSKWSTVFINRGHGDWKLCTDKIEEFKNYLLQEMRVSYETCKLYFDESFSTTWCASINFPGKILLESFYRYLKYICNSEKKGSFGPVTNTKALISQLSSRLIRNAELEQILLRVVS